MNTLIHGKLGATGSENTVSNQNSARYDGNNEPRKTLHYCKTSY